MRLSTLCIIGGIANLITSVGVAVGFVSHSRIWEAVAWALLAGFIFLLGAMEAVRERSHD